MLDKDKIELRCGLMPNMTRMDRHRQAEEEKNKKKNKKNQDKKLKKNKCSYNK